MQIDYVDEADEKRGLYGPWTHVRLYDAEGFDAGFTDSPCNVRLTRDQWRQIRSEVAITNDDLTEHEAEAAEAADFLGARA